MAYDHAIDEWADAASGWDEDDATHAYAAAAHASLTTVAAGHGLELAGARVLDFGCGTGLLTERLVDVVARVAAVDSSPAMLAVLDRKVRDRGWTNVTTASRPFGDDLDLVVASSVCSFLDDYPATAAALVARLRPGGVFVQWDWEHDDEPADGAGRHGLTRHEIVEALSAAGLVDVAVATAFDVEVDGATMRPLVGHGRRPRR